MKKGKSWNRLVKGLTKFDVGDIIILPNGRRAKVTKVGPFVPGEHGGNMVVVCGRHIEIEYLPVVDGSEKGDER